MIQTRARTIRTKRQGQILVLMAEMLPAIFGILGLVIDGSLLMLEARNAQNAADAAALAAASQMRLGNDTTLVIAAAEDEVSIHHGLSAAVTVNRPPTSGPHSGESNYVEVLIERPVNVLLMQLVSQQESYTVHARSVASVDAVTADAAIVILDPDPQSLSISPLPLALPALPSLIAGLEVLGVGTVEVHGAVIVNNEWGRVDEDGRCAGNYDGPPYAVACTPLVPLNKFKSEDLYVVGGVDSQHRYHPLEPGETPPLRANRMSVPDPLAELPVPTVSTDPANVSNVYYGGRTIVGLPIGLPTRLSPGVYDWIYVVSGRVVFEPGIYIIRGTCPANELGLSLLAGQIEAEGVMFYFTNNDAYTADSGLPDATDIDSLPPGTMVGALTPSAIVNLGLLGSTFSPLDSPGSPFDGMMFYQRRNDRRPLVIVQENILGSGSLQGRIYAKWGHVLLAGNGTYDATIVAGTMRVIGLGNVEIKPTDKLPPAESVFLVE